MGGLIGGGGGDFYGCMDFKTVWPPMWPCQVLKNPLWPCQEMLVHWAGRRGEGEEGGLTNI